MRSDFSHIEKYRVKSGVFASKPGDMFGLFFIGFRSKIIKVICAPNDMQWEHVSASMAQRCPTWNEMHFVKNLFWEPEETVIQLHPPESNYVNKCKNCLHLWRNKNQKIELPPLELV